MSRWTVWMMLAIPLIWLGGCASGTPGPTTECGNGLFEGAEQCDDGNLNPGDGCSELCETEDGWTCAEGGETACQAICGDGRVLGQESCDGSELGGATCESLSMGGGTLACDPVTCQLDPEGCTAYSCGNGRLDNGELCDGPDVGEHTCETEGYDGGSLACTASCELDNSGCTLASCGNGIVEGVEACDDGNLNPADGCSSNCSIEQGWACVGQPSVCALLCGNSGLDTGEQCDGANLGGQTCESLGQSYVGGTLACAMNCTFDTSGCDLPTCGNSTLDTGEQCDGVLMNGQTCETVGAYIGGTLQCTGNCAYDVTGCVPIVCGDGVISTGEACDDNNTSSGDGCNILCNVESGYSCSGEPSTCTLLCGNNTLDGGEQCDGGQLGGATCQTQGYDQGSLACLTNCTFDTAGCSMFSCGDGQVTGLEDCDGGNLDGGTCLTEGFVGGALSCTGNCAYDTSNCIAPVCGDGIITTAIGEQCDDNDTSSGDGCNAACQVENGWICSGEPSTCVPSCGNGNVDPGEECDGSNHNGQDCQSQGFAGGTLACSNCSFDTGSCLPSICPNGTKESGEECDGSDFGGQDCTSFGFATGSLSCTGACTIDTSGCATCAASGCSTDNSPNARTCSNAKIVGRVDAAGTASYLGDTDSSSNSDNDNLSAQDYNGVNCWDARKDDFYRIYLMVGDHLNAVLDPESGFDPMMKLYRGTTCDNNGTGDLVMCVQDGYNGANEVMDHTAIWEGWYSIVVDGRHSSDPDGSYSLDITLTYGSSGSCCP